MMPKPVMHWLSSTLGRAPASLGEEERERRRRLRELRQEQASTLRAIKKRREARRAGTFREASPLQQRQQPVGQPAAGGGGYWRPHHPMGPPYSQLDWETRMRAKSTPRKGRKRRRISIAFLQAQIMSIRFFC